MKEWLQNIDGLFENKVRLAIMSLLMVNESLSFKELKDKLGITDGNLASHTNKLEGNKYLEINKQFRGKKPLTTYKATLLGTQAFKKHINAIEQLLTPNK